MKDTRWQDTTSHLTWTVISQHASGTPETPASRHDKLAALFGGALAASALAAPAGAVLPLAARLAVLQRHGRAAHDAVSSALQDLSCTANDGVCSTSSSANCVPNKFANVVQESLIVDLTALRFDRTGQSNRCAECHNKEDLELA